MTLYRALLALALTACGGGTIRSAPAPLTLSFAADTQRAQLLRPGVTRRFIYSSSGGGPWAIHMLDVDLARCYSAVALKGAPGAIGREKTSTLLSGLAASRDVVGGVNADFFLFAPPGVPSGALISGGRVVTGPTTQPVLAFTADGEPRITRLSVAGSVGVGGEQLIIGRWNRHAPNGLALFDAAWGETTDTTTAAIEIVLSGRGPPPSRVMLIDTLPAGVAIPQQGSVLIAGPNAPASVRAALRSLRVGDTVRTAVSLAPLHPREAVGGRPILVRDSIVADGVDTEGQPGFATGRHPRTAVGIARGGKRLLLVVVDGRQTPHSDGMTLRELANLMLAVGARDAINLDGGGSTTLVYADPDSAGALRIANKPSDPQGERAVGNALAIVRGCDRR